MPTIQELRKAYYCQFIKQEKLNPKYVYEIAKFATWIGEKNEYIIVLELPEFETPVEMDNDSIKDYLERFCGINV